MPVALPRADLSPEAAARTLEQVSQHPGQTVLQRCLSVLIDFVYTHIAAKRREAIKVMEQAITVGLQEGNFADYIYTYFDSKYTPELRHISGTSGWTWSGSI